MSIRLLSGFLLAGLGQVTALAQSTPDGGATSDTLTARALDAVVVRAYESNRSLLTTAAAVGVLSRRDLVDRFATPTLVSAMNTVPGVRMDERSPGSYRLSIRGSLIRSPFGVRNVKVYYQDMPLTDAAGNTPLNALDVRMLGRVEVIKGPSGSVYGANTGGTVLLSGPANVPGQNQVTLNALGGGYGQRGYGVLAQTANDRSSLSLSVNHLQASGYRDHSSLVRDNVALTGTVRPDDRQTLTALFIYSDLAYQTPGGLTEAQFRANPAASRPATRTLPGSAEQGAAIYQKTGYLGLSHTMVWNPRWQTTNVLYGSSTELNNPFITNYERRTDQGLGVRSVTRFRQTAPTSHVPLTLVFGGEGQTNRTGSRNFGNRGGRADTLQTDDELRARQWNVFVQQEANLPDLGLLLTAGLSRNETGYGFTRFSLAGKPGPGLQERTFTPAWLWRFSALKTLGSNLSVFVNASTGYSAPTSQEVLSSAGFFNAALNPERGTQAELGLRGRLGDRLQLDLVGYSLRLRETIVRRSLENGAEYFVNAGNTQQSGLETSLRYDLIRPMTPTGARLNVWQSLTLADYTYRNYQQLDVDLSGKHVPGVAPFTGIWGLDYERPNGLYAHLTFQYLPPFALNDANTAQADPTRLLQATVGYRHRVGTHLLGDLYVGGDNLLDQTYSLGYDLNAVGNRYYNAAPRRYLTVGLRLTVR